MDTPTQNFSNTNNHAQKQWKETCLESDYIKFKAVRDQYIWDIRTSQKTMWIEFLANAQGTEIFTALRYTKPRKTQRTPPLSFSNITAVTFEEKAVLFRSTMFLPPPVASSPTNITNRSTLSWVTSTPTEIKQEIFTSAPRKAPAPDGLPFHCLWQVYLAATKQFNSLFAIFGTTGYHPTCWQQATTVIIPKPGKPDCSIAKAYQPVTLLNCLGKILKKLMAN